MTPSATPAAWGQVLLGHDTALPGVANAGPGHNFQVAVGLLPGLEIAGRLATDDLNCNQYGLGANPCTGASQRDLSASLKLGHRVPLKRWPGLSLSVAAGATDLGGAATNYRSYYTVLGLDRGPWALHAGWARGVSNSAPLHGGFGSLAWRPRDWLQLQAERIGPRGWVGGKLLLPTAWRPDAIEPWLSFQRSLHGDGFTPRQWWGVGVAIQLDRPRKGGASGGVSGGASGGSASHLTGDAEPMAATSPAAAATSPAPAAPADAAAHAAAHASAGAPAMAAPAGLALRQDGLRDIAPRLSLPAAAQDVSPALSPSSLSGDSAHGPAVWSRHLAQRLARAGFEDISIDQARSGGPVVVEAENSGYAWNDLDALGVAMGQIGQTGQIGQIAQIVDIGQIGQTG